MAVIVFHQHSSELLEYLHRLYKENQLCDTTVHSSDGVAFSTHRVVLGSASAYLQQIFLNFNETVVYLDFTTAVLQVLLQYCYTGQLQVSEQIIPEVQQAATFLQMQRVVDRLKSICSVENSVGESCLKSEAVGTGIGAIRLPDIKSEQDSLNYDIDDNDDGNDEGDFEDDDHVNSFSDDESPDVVMENGRTSQEEPLLDIENPKKTISKRRQKNPPRTIKCTVMLEKLHPGTVRKSSRNKKSIQVADNSVSNIVDNKTITVATKTSKSVKFKSNKVGIVHISKLKKNIGGKKRKRLISKSCDIRRKDLEKYKKRISCASKSRTFKIKESKFRYNIFTPKRNSGRCAECEIRFSSYHKLKRHNLKLHTNDIIQHLHGQYILKRCLKQNLHDKKFWRKISTRLKMGSGKGNHTKLSQSFSPAIGLMQFINVKLKQYKTLGSQLNKAVYTNFKMKQGTRVVSPRQTTRKVASVYKCPRCNEQLNSQDFVYKHLQYVHKVSAEEAQTLQFYLPEALVCEASMCDYTSRNLGEMKSHMLNKHPSIRHKCTRCTSSYPVSLMLERHMKKSHSPGGPRHVACDVYKMKFPTRHKLNSHLLNDHDVQPPNVKAITMKKDNQRWWICRHCGKGIKTKNALKQHENRHEGKGRYKCCGQVFFSAANLRRHRCSQHGEFKQYLCPNCGKSYATNADLNRHIQAEEGRNAVKCKLCNFKAPCDSRLREHMGCHMKERQHRCRICSKAYKFRCGLSRHMGLKHKK